MKQIERVEKKTISEQSHATAPLERSRWEYKWTDKGVRKMETKYRAALEERKNEFPIIILILKVLMHQVYNGWKFTQPHFGYFIAFKTILHKY